MSEEPPQRVAAGPCACPPDHTKCVLLLNIIDWRTENDNPPPTWNDSSGSVFISFFPATLPDTSKTIIETTPEVTPEVRLLMVMKDEMTRKSLQEALKLKDGEYFRKSYLQPALESGLIAMTIPDKPRSSKQKYRLTKKGLKKLNLLQDF